MRKSKPEEITLIGAFLMAMGEFIILSIFKPFSLINIISGICAIITLFDLVLVQKVFGDKVKKTTDVFCVAFIMLTMSVQWVETGGFSGIGPYWMIFATIFCIFIIEPPIRNIQLMIFGLYVLFIVSLGILKPGIIVKIDDTFSTILSGFGLLSLGIYLQCIILARVDAINQSQRDWQEIQKKLEDNYAESLAINKELVETTSKLEMANKTQRSFNASMNHELRAPLNGIEGCLQILLMDEEMSEESKETVRNALTASKTINHTVNDILDFAKLEEGKFEITKRPFDLREVLDNVMTIFRPQASAKNLKFIIQIPVDSRVSIVGDSVRIQQIMTNLISNGIKYTKTGSVKLIVTTQRGHLKFSVKDTGMGMTEDSLKVLFDPFTRFDLEKNANIQGTGLGMNIVHNLIKEMGGSITVQSKIDEGTVFDVDIPIMFYDSNITYGTERTKDAGDEEVVNLEKLRILCVDDSEINRTVFKGLLKKTGAKVTSIDCGSRAIKLCEQVKFDIVFLDHMMPEMDGLETLEKIRKIEGGQKYKKVPIVMFTGNAGDEYIKMYKDAGADGYLLKPVMYEELIDCFKLIHN